MKTFLCIFAGVLLSFVNRSYCIINVLKRGDVDAWWYNHYGTSKISSNSWSRYENKFHSNDEENGEWFVTQTLQLPNGTVDYHMDIEVKITSCGISVKTKCFLQVYIYTGTESLDIPDGSSGSDGWKIKAKSYLLSHFTLLYDVTIAELGKFETQSFNFLHNGSEAIFGVRARAILGSLLDMKLYYYYCEETVLNGVKLVQTIAPPSGLKSVTANCTSNAVTKYNESSFVGLCSYNGTWWTGNETACLCRPGYRMSLINGINMGCKRCSEGYYKSNRSNEECMRCPARSTNDSTNTMCNCNKYNYRLPFQKGVDTAPCYGFPSKVRHIKVLKSNSSRTVIRLSWDLPSDDGGISESLRYDIDCAKPCPKLAFNPRDVNLSQTKVKISNLKPGRNYNFRVFSKNIISEIFSNGSFKFENETYKVRERFNNNDPEFMLKTEYKIAAGICTFLILILLIALVGTLTRRKRHKNKCSMPDCGIELPDIGQKMYVDPLNYADVETALKDFANEVDPTSISLERMIGGGEFGDVYKAKLTLPDGNVILVAAKTLKTNANEKSCQDFFLEASAMGQFDDPNVIHLQGVITRVLPKMILTEFMSNGSLDHFLKKNDGGLTAIQLFSIARGVASGMRYLAAINFVHRDLAARNILVDENIVCKVADFGLSRELETTDSSRGEYFTQGGKIPVRWTSPEAIKYRIFSTASDVWSYGILLWEIMTFAQRPYWEWDNFKVMERVDAGFRLPSPVNCPQAVYNLMLKCWDKERSLRPRFQDILETVDEWIESPECLHQPPSMRERSNQLQCSATSTSVTTWLEDIKMSSYMPHFAAAGYENLSDLAGLLDNDLKALGISLVGHRNKMLRTIRSLPITNAV